MTKEKNYFYDGLYAYNNKDYEKAINCFNEIIDKFSNSIGNAKLSETYYMRGICYAQEYSIDEALEDFNEAEKLGFDKSKIYCGRGIAYAHDGKNGEAVSNFTKAIELNGSYEEAYCRKGIAYFFDLKFDEAIINFNKAIELNKYYDKAYYYRGLVYYNKNEYDKAFENFKKFKPNDALNYMVKLFLTSEKSINNIENLTIKYADSYFTSVIGKNIKINKSKLFKIWCYQYVLLDLLSIKNY